MVKYVAAIGTCWMSRSEIPFLKLLKSCHNGRSVASVHSVLLKAGLSSLTLFAAELTRMYAILCSSKNALLVFDETVKKTTFLYNTILRTHVSEGHWQTTLFIFRQMHSTSLDLRPDCYTLPIVLKACAKLFNVRLGETVHGLVNKGAAKCSDMFVGAALVGMYSSCGRMADACSVFDEFLEPDVVLWTSIVSSFIHNGCSNEALSFFRQMSMREENVHNPVTLTNALAACAHLGASKLGRSCHGCIVRSCFTSELSLNNALLNFYAKVGIIRYGKRHFENMVVRDIITWSCMIACYVENSMPDEGLRVYDEMVERGFKPNSLTALSILKACGITRNLARGKKVHEFATQRGFQYDSAVCTALIDMYMKCSCFDEAVRLFNQVPHKDVVLWSALISGYSQKGLADQSLCVFRDMLANGVSPDAVTIVKILASCSQLRIMKQAQCIHGHLVLNGFDNNLFVGAALVDLYSKCGSLSNAIEVFDGMKEKDVVAWSSIISAYGSHGRGEEALKMFSSMISSSLKPNHIAFVSVLSACSHAGLVEEAMQMFDSMLEQYGVVPRMEHYSIIVDLLCRQGYLEKALEFITHMPIPAGPHAWAALLNGCTMHNNLKIGEIAGKSLMKLEPNHPGYHSLLSNLYANNDRWDMATNVRRSISTRDLARTPGVSSIENDEILPFVACGAS